MSELALTMLRLGFLALLWVLVLVAVAALRRDLKAPRDARPLVAVPARTAAAPARPGARPSRPRPSAADPGASSWWRAR